MFVIFFWIFFLAHLINRACLITICPLSVVVVVETFHIFIIISRTTGPILPRLGIKCPWVKGIKVCSNKGPRSFPRGDNYEIAKTMTNFTNLLLKNHWTNFDQTWNKSSLGKRNSSFFKWRALPFSKGK